MPRSTKLTEDEKITILKLYQEGKTIGEISIAIKRHPNTIERITRHVNKSNNNLITKNNVNKLTSDTDKYKFWLQYFKSTPRYNKLSKTLTNDDLELFSHKWVEYHIEYDDFTVAEEDTLELLITYHLRINENNKSLRKVKEYEKTLEKKLSEIGELDTENNDFHSMLFAQIQENNAKKSDLTREYKDLTDKCDALSKSLNVTRSQRESTKQIGGETFMTLVKQFNDRDIRAKMNQYNEYMKEAAKKSTARLKQNHTFMNGEISPIILTGEDNDSKTK